MLINDEDNYNYKSDSATDDYFVSTIINKETY
jgi:hypothetical protein